MTSASGLKKRRWPTAAVALATVATVALSVLAFRHAATPAASAGCASGGKIVSFIGDSYTAGVEGDGGYSRRFPALIGDDLDASVLIRASNGSGYATTGPADDALDYPGQAATVDPQSSVVVMSGSRNDMPAAAEQIEADTTRALASIKASAPSAKIVLIGPFWINNLPSDKILAVRDAVKASADKASITMVDPLKLGWFGEPGSINGGKSDLIGPDSVHPTAEGQAYLADKIEPFVRDALCS